MEMEIKTEVFDEIKKRLEKVSEFMGLNNEEMSVLLKHEKVSHAVLEVNGKNYDAWRIIHNNALGPGKGGIRFHPDVSEDEVKSLSFWMSLKTSLMGLALGGAKGGVKINPKELSKEELEKLSRAYIRAFANVVGQDKDIPAPDVYTNSQIMAWMLDEYEKIKDCKEPGMITGKPVELGGIALRADSTSAGGLIVLKEFLKKIEKEKEDLKDGEDLKIAIQGFGNAGMNIAKMLDKEGFKINAVSDSKGGIFNDNGLNIEEVIEIKKESGSVVKCDCRGLEKISNKDLLELDVDLLILGALENQITKENVEDVKAKYILELANGPVSYEADKRLFEKGVIVIPDILANAGGVVVSYFEWMLNKGGSDLDKKDLKKEFHDIMVNSFNKVWELFDNNKDKLDMRSASYVIAIKRILEGERARERL